MNKHAQEPITPENAHRVTACVNACHFIKTENLERVTGARMIAALEYAEGFLSGFEDDPEYGSSMHAALRDLRILIGQSDA